MVYLSYVVHTRFILSYTKIGRIRICKVHVRRNKWCIYLMLFKINTPYIPSYMNFTNTYTFDLRVRQNKPYVYKLSTYIRFVLSYTKIEGLRICKVHVGRNKWCIYFMLFTYGLFCLTRRSKANKYTIYSVLHELYKCVNLLSSCKTEQTVCEQHQINTPFIPSYMNFTNNFMLYTYGLFCLTRR
jgi:hypothetical protein